VWDHRRGRPKPDPTVGEERQPVTEATPSRHVLSSSRDESTDA
jgi:hypothetical protein